MFYGPKICFVAAFAGVIYLSSARVQRPIRASGGERSPIGEAMNDACAVETQNPSEIGSRNLQYFGAEEQLSAEEELFRWQAEKLHVLLEIMLRLPRKDMVADVGCFTGLAATRYREAGAVVVHCYDMSPVALARARTRGFRTFQWQAGDAACPNADHVYDLVVAADVIEHVVNTDFFVAELKRITKPGGHLLLTTPNLGFWLSRIRLLRGRVPWSYPGVSATIRRDIFVDNNHVRIGLASEWEGLFAAHHLDLVLTKGWSIMGAFQSIPLRRFVDRILTRRPSLAYGLVFLLRNPVDSGAASI